MHCRSCSGSGFLTGSLQHHGFRSSTTGSSMAMASRVRSSVLVLCQDEGGRRISYKRRQQLPARKGLSPSSIDGTTDHVSFNLHPHKTRALEFLCDNEETTTSSTTDEFRVVSDGTWSSRMLMQIQVDLMWLTIQSSSLRPLSRSGHAGALARQPHLHEEIMAVEETRSLADVIGRLDFFQWLERLKETYGASFMLLVVLGYCTHGFRCFPWLAMCYYFKDHLQVDPGTMQFLMSTTMLPMLAKPVYGIVSDSIYIKGDHRVPYLTIAAGLQVVAWGAIVTQPGVSSSVAVLTAALTMSNMGAAISEVVNDALVAEAVKNKKGARQGELQSLAWLALATGGLIGNLMGGFALQTMDATTMFSIFMLLVGTQLLLCTTTQESSFGLQQQTSPTTLHQPPNPMSEQAIVLPHKTKRITSRTFKYTDTAHTPVTEVLNLANPSTSDPKPRRLDMRGQIELLSTMLQKPAVYRPLLWFLSSYAVIPLLGSTMFFYQTQYLGLNSSVIGLVKVVGQTGLVAGTMLYNKKLKKVPLRKLFGGIQVLLSLCMLSDIVLVNRMNVAMGIPDEVFVFGASAFVEAISQFKILPFLVLLAQLCPAGSEGSLLAFFMSAQCLAGLMSAYLGVGLAGWLHISANSFEELPVGILVQAGFALLPVLWINFIPDEAVGDGDAKKKKLGVGGDSSTQVHID